MTNRCQIDCRGFRSGPLFGRRAVPAIFRKGTVAGPVPAAGQSMVLHHIMEKAPCRAVVPARRNVLLRLMTRAVTPAVIVFSILQIHWPIRVLLVSSPVHHPGIRQEATPLKRRQDTGDKLRFLLKSHKGYRNKRQLLNTSFLHLKKNCK